MNRDEESGAPPRVVEIAASEVDGLRALADERAALLRVAELAARAAAPADIFAAVVTEASRLLGGQPTTLPRFDADRGLVVVASHEGPAPVGDRIGFEPDTLPDRVLRRAGSSASTTTRRNRTPCWPRRTVWPRRCPSRSRWPVRCGGW